MRFLYIFNFEIFVYFQFFFTEIFIFQYLTSTRDIFFSLSLSILCQFLFFCWHILSFFVKIFHLSSISLSLYLPLQDTPHSIDFLTFFLSLSLSCLSPSPPVLDIFSQYLFISLSSLNISYYFLIHYFLNFPYVLFLYFFVNFHSFIFTLLKMNSDRVVP